MLLALSVVCVVGLCGSAGVSSAQEDGAATEAAVEESAEAAPEETPAEEAAAEEANPLGWNEGDPVDSLSYDDANDYAINTLIMFICAVLVIFMQAGFAMVEIGLNSAKNAVNIL